MTEKEAYNILIGCHISAATPTPKEVNEAILTALKVLKEKMESEK